MVCSASDEFRCRRWSQLRNTTHPTTGDSNMTTNTATQISQVATVIVPVSDQDRAIEFYSEKLGFEKRADIPLGPDYRWVEVAPLGASTTIAIVPPREGEPTSVKTGIALKTEDA